MRSYVLIGLILLSIILILSSGGVALPEKGTVMKNMTTPMIMKMPMNKTTTMNKTTMMNMTLPMNMSNPMNMTMPMNMKMPMSMPMNMPNKMANGSMSMVMLQNVTLNIILIQNLTEVTITPGCMNETNKNKNNSFNASKPSAKAA
jgi:hypothetical protein